MSLAGAVTRCDRAPPSDQEANSHTVGKDPCGDGAWMPVCELTMTVLTKGETPVVVPALSWRPAFELRGLNSLPVVF